MPAGCGRGIRGPPPRPPRPLRPPPCGTPAPIGPGAGLPLTPSGPFCTPPIGTYGGPPAGTVVCWPSIGIPPNIMPPPIAAAVAAIMPFTNLRRDSTSINNSWTFPCVLYSLQRERSSCNPTQNTRYGRQILGRLDHRSRKFDRLQANVPLGSRIFTLGVGVDGPGILL